MAKFSAESAFVRRHKKLSKADKESFAEKVKEFEEDLDAGVKPRPSLGVRIFQKYRKYGVYEFKWASDGRALFKYDDDADDGEKHVVWLIIGTHAIYETWSP